MIYLPTLKEIFGINRKIEEHGKWQPKWVISRYKDDRDYQAHNPYDISVVEGNLLTTNGVNAIWTLLTGGGGTTWAQANAQIGVGDSSTAASAGQTDLQAALQTKLNAADITSASNATPIVCAGTYSPTPTVGEVCNFSGFTGAGASAINGVFELSAASGSSITLLNSAGTGAITVTGAIIQPVNKYRQGVNAAPSITTNQISFTSAVGANNANHVWQEFGAFNNLAATNKQAVAGTMLNRLVSNQGTKAQGATWTVTLQISIT